MKHLLRAAAIATALFMLGAQAASAAHVLAEVSTGAPAPTMSLLATDTADAYPFAAIAVNGKVFHVTEGDKFFGAYVETIATDELTFSDGRVLRTGVAVLTR
jgi:hypothetical protein